MHDGALGSAQGLVCLAYQMLACLGQHHDGHIVRYELTFDEQADEVVIRRGRRGEADFHFLEAHAHQEVPEPQLALGVHRVDQCLVAIA
jgi:hypothetical protein